MTFLDDFLNFIPGASLIQKAVRHEKVDATDFMPGSKMAISSVTTGMNLFGKVAGNTISKSISTIGVGSSNLVSGLNSGLASGAPMTTAAARKSPQESVAYAPQQEDNTMTYAAAGLGVIAVAGTAYIVLKK